MYESYYGLNSKPFQLTPDPEFFFASKLHKRAMSYLQYGLSQAEGFIVITGDIGTGKTTIANSLLNDIEADIYAAQIVTPKLSPDEIIKMVAAKFGIDTGGKSKTDLLQSLQNFLEQLAASGKRALLVVDEAQNLPLETIEELRMLSNFQQSGKPLLQSFLLGQAELQPILRAPNMEQFRQRIVASCHLAPLNFEECCSYINYRLEHAGSTRTDLFTEDAFAAIHKFTTGVPRKINTLMDRVLLYGFLEEVDSFGIDDVTQVIHEVQAEMFVPEDPAMEVANEMPSNPVAPVPIGTEPTPTETEPVKAEVGVREALEAAQMLEPTAVTQAPQSYEPNTAPQSVTNTVVDDLQSGQVEQSESTLGVTSLIAPEELEAPSTAEELQSDDAIESLVSSSPEPIKEVPTRPVYVTPNGNTVQEAEYYKEMLGELVDALDDAIKHKVKLTQYIDKLLKKKYQTYVRLKGDDGK